MTSRRAIRPRAVLAAIICLLGTAAAAQAHKLGESYLFLQVDPHGMKGRLEFTLIDADKALDLDGDNDGKVSPQELEANIAKVEDYLRQRVLLSRSGEPLPIEFGKHEIITALIGQYASLHLEVAGAPPDMLGITYNAFFEIDDRHRGFLVVEYNHKTGHRNDTEAVSMIFAPDSGIQHLDLTKKPSRWREFGAFVGHGIWHIWIGIDHILFLVALILPAVLRRNGDQQWEPVSSFRPALMQIIKIVTLFTVAHSITLCLAALQIVSLPGRLVESVIAVSVLAAAINNLFPLFRDWNWIIIFIFGLFHGLGFASVLGDLIVTQGSLWSTLVGFNVGVEIGQVAVILALFPVLFAARQLHAYRWAALQAGSVVIALIAGLWSIERILGLDSILGFI